MFRLSASICIVVAMPAVFASDPSKLAPESSPLVEKTSPGANKLVLPIGPAVPAGPKLWSSFSLIGGEPSFGIIWRQPENVLVECSRIWGIPSTTIHKMKFVADTPWSTKSLLVPSKGGNRLNEIHVYLGNSAALEMIETTKRKPKIKSVFLTWYPLEGVALSIGLVRPLPILRLRVCL